MGILSAVIVLGVLVFVHELGHFLVAKYFGVGVLEFALGFGPVLASFQRGETTYSIRSIPLGGFVRMAGDDPALVQGGEVGDARSGGASPIEGTQEELTPAQVAMLKDEKRWFLRKAYGPRCAIVLAGPLANFLFGFVLAAGMYYCVGLPKVTLESDPVVVGDVTRGMPAEGAGIKAGDRLVTVNGQQIENFKQLQEIVVNSGGKALEVAIERPIKGGEERDKNVEKFSLSVKPEGGNPELDLLEGRGEDKVVYRIGIAPAVKTVTYEPMTLVDALDAGQRHIIGASYQLLRMLKGLVVGKVDPRKAIGGPIEIIKQTAKSADDGFGAVISLMILLNVTLGVMNLLPIPVLDGGHLVFFTAEKIRGRPLSLRFLENATRFGMLVLLFLMMYATRNDILRMIPKDLF